MSQGSSQTRVDTRTAARVAFGSGLPGEPVGVVLGRVAEMAKRTVPGAAEVSVTLMKRGKARSIAFTGPLAVHLDERQYEQGFGPCLDAAVAGGLIAVPDMAAETVYTDFADVARRQGVTHSLSIGLPIGTSTIGGINLYGTDGDRFDAEAVELAGDFAGYAAIAVANAAALADAAEEVAGLRAAMETRAVIEQAKGIVMYHRHCTADEAFRVLVEASNTSKRKLRDVAAGIVESTQRS